MYTGLYPSVHPSARPFLRLSVSILYLLFFVYQCIFLPSFHSLYNLMEKSLKDLVVALLANKFRDFYLTQILIAVFRGAGRM